MNYPLDDSDGVVGVATIDLLPSHQISYSLQTFLNIAPVHDDFITLSKF